MDTGQKMKFPICPVDIKFDISLNVFHKAKYRMCMTFDSILYKIGGVQSIKCPDFMLHRTNGKFNFLPCGKCFHIVIQNWMMAEAVLINIKLLINSMQAYQ